MLFNENNNYFDMVENEIIFNKYIDQGINKDININIDSINFNRSDEIYTPLEGFNKGNMFPNNYLKYKDYVYKLKVNNNKDEMLYKIQMYTFALKDYNLYLDIYPNDVKILREFRDLNKELDSLKSNYEQNYGPLCITSVNSTSKWTWLDEPWPWDKGGNK